MTNKFKRSSEYFKEAGRHIPGGVNSPVRAFKAVGGEPLFIEKGAGSKVYDVDGNSYIDFVLSWGPLILGHAHPEVVEAIKLTAQKGTSFGAPTELETELAILVKNGFPSIELIRFVNSGTEAVMSAIRLARGYSKRDKVIKFEGCYHGHSDSLLVKAGSGIATLGIPESSGVPADFVKNTIVMPYNDIEAVKKAVKTYSGEIACIIVEPIAGNMGVVPPKAGFLECLREITKNENIILIFDETITGFRVSFGGAQQLYNISPDLTCLGKIIGGGLPVGAFGGKGEIMGHLAPQGPVYQAGTLSGNPVAMAAGIATLKQLLKPDIYKKIDHLAKKLTAGISAAAKDASIPVYINRVGSMFSVFFTDIEVADYTTAKKSDTALYRSYFWKMLAEGIYFAPSSFESAFLSNSHSETEMDLTVNKCRKIFSELKED